MLIKFKKKTGIFQRYIANKDETSLDLGFLHAKNLFKEYDLNPEEIDALLFISQTPDYALPSFFLHFARKAWI